MPWVGGSELASSFLEQRLIDELHFIMTPILLGAGHAEFVEIKKRHELELLSTKVFNSENVILTYAPMRG